MNVSPVKRILVRSVKVSMVLAGAGFLGLAVLLGWVQFFYT
jgi:hypothetical protein